MNEAILHARRRRANFPAGAAFRHNNGARNLLGSILRRVSGQLLRAFAETNILRRSA